jgi:hypothetical protein
VVESALRSSEIVDNWQIPFGIADAENAPRNSVADDHPVHIASHALNADVIQSSEALTAEEVDPTQIEDELFRDARVALHEATQCLSIGRVDFAGNDNAHARGGNLASFESATASDFSIVGGWRVKTVKPESAAIGHASTPSSDSYRGPWAALQSEGRINGILRVCRNRL